MIIKNQKGSEYFKNIFYRIRFWYFRNFKKSKLKNKSDARFGKGHLVFEEDFDDSSWVDRWNVGGHAPYHPDYKMTYYGPPSKVHGTSYALFTVEYKPKIFPANTWPNDSLEELTIPFEVTRISTIDTFKQQYGRFECRCSLPTQKGVWPAFWMWGSTWPPEIDVFETYGGKKAKTNFIQKINLHFGKVIDGTKSDMGAWGIRVGNRKKKHQWHEFACEWRRDKIEFFTDGVKVFTYSRKDILDKWFNVKDAKMWVVVNHSIEADVISKEDKDFKSHFYVDYVRVYQ